MLIPTIIYAELLVRQQLDKVLYPRSFMKLLLFIATFLSLIANADILIFAKDGLKVEKMNRDLMYFISETLHISKPALNLECDVKVNEIKQERKFSDGVHIVEMLEVIYRSRYFGVPEQKIYFPLGSKVTRDVVNSRFAGTVEEIQLEAEDMANAHFTFQHNGMKEIVWMKYEDDLKTVPCQLKP